MRGIEESIRYSIVSRKVQVHKVVHKLIAPIGACKNKKNSIKSGFHSRCCKAEGLIVLANYN